MQPLLPLGAIRENGSQVSRHRLAHLSAHLVQAVANHAHQAELRLKAAVSVTGDVDGQFFKFALERLFALAVSGAWVGNGFVLNYLGFESPLDQAFGQLLFVICQQAVYQFVAYGHFSFFDDEGSFLPLDRLYKI